MLYIYLCVCMYWCVCVCVCFRVIGGKIFQDSKNEVANCLLVILMLTLEFLFCLYFYFQC